MSARFVRFALVGVLFAGLGIEAEAIAVYSYQGTTYASIVNQDPPAGMTFDSSMSISGFFSVPSPLISFNGPVLPASFSFSSGAFTFTDTTPSLNALIIVVTDTFG